MKSNGNLRGSADTFGPEDTLRKATKLPPIKKSGKEKMSYYRELDPDDDDEFDLKSLHKRESVLDYFDDQDDFQEDEWVEEDDESVSDEEWDEGDEDWED